MGGPPFTMNECMHLTKDLKLLINAHFIKIADIGNTPVAFIVAAQLERGHSRVERYTVASWMT